MSSVAINALRQHRSVLNYVSLLCSLLVFTASGSAQSATPATQSAATQGQAAPASLNLGFEVRTRTEDWNNILDLSDATDDERRQMRYRSRVWMKFNSDSVDFNVGLVDEFYKKFALKPSDTPAYNFNLDEVVFESLNLSFKKLPIRGLTLTIGRQDLQRGEGFILFDGTAGDGSRTAYFNAVNLAYQHKKSKYELIGILDPRQDRFLGIIHDQQKNLQEWDEQAVGLYYTNREHKTIDVDSYYFYKKEVHDYRPATNAQFQPDRHIHTLGTRVVKRFPNGYTVNSEFATQWGGQHENPVRGTPAADIRAWGGYGYAKKTFSASWKPYVLAEYWALSGDDPNDPATLTGFDPIFSRWPKMSELVVYSFVPERGIAYWSNVHMLQFEAGASPTNKLNLRATFFEQRAFHPAVESPTVFGGGTHRGENYQVRADYKFNNWWKCHVLYENFVPGDFFRGSADSFFLQAQILFQFNSKFQLHTH